MKRVFVKEEWCLGCHLCEYNCAFANTNEKDMALALKDKPVMPRICVEGEKVSFAVSCRHCEKAVCVEGCISGALHKENGIVKIDYDKCVGCLTCLLVCPYGALAVSDAGVVRKCELCVDNNCGTPACVKGCPNRAIVFEER